MAVQAQTMYFSENLGMSGFPQQQDWSLINPPPLSDPGFDHDFFSGLIPDPQTHQQQQVHQFHPNLGVSSVSNSPNSTCNSFLPTTSFSDTLTAQLDLQRQEIDCILQLQNEKLRFALQEQRKRQLAALLRNFESRTSSLIRQKEEHLSQARKRAMELQDCLRKAEMETETWQRLAKANETMVMDLNNTLEQVKERRVLCSNGTDDAESFCGSSCEKQEVLSEKAVHNKKLGLDCKSCNARRSCVLFLPCRHLCSCKFCEAFLDYCPVCKSTKEASMEVFLV
ncbi:PREDICTED: probable BOI-related E3 ubiquitin-protein ligase 2 [Fragaria vesca subsp. vesca]|uniref:probable BOI-related E3 ubiquitin-protein ligase 2 n=1 Tax=Fragaria vesca subsp. vesca TaxID=101020 RepID=UPI0002C2F4D0|nr:PREDICTED: probable BOI-related E3 ubiquitin-protein ligase 2 [Fragaria vesca subsp. vesca]